MQEACCQVNQKASKFFNCDLIMKKLLSQENIFILFRAPFKPTPVACKWSHSIKVTVRKTCTSFQLIDSLEQKTIDKVI